MPFEFFQTS